MSTLAGEKDKADKDISISEEVFFLPGHKRQTNAILPWKVLAKRQFLLPYS